MVLLTVTAAVKAALDEYARLQTDAGDDAELEAKFARYQQASVGSPIEHHDLVEVSRYLVSHITKHAESDATATRAWRLDTILRGADVYRPPPPPKPEPTSEYKALMARLRKEEERRQYERMINPLPAPETFDQRFPNAARSFNPHTSHGQTGVDEGEEMTYQDVDRQMALIINVLVSIIACSVAIWVAARHWSVPQRLGLSMSGSLTVAVAEVAIYLGYIRRVKDAKGKETKKVETKEVSETWVIEKAEKSLKTGNEEALRYRKGKHR